jgi:hypothetical protein
MGISCRRVDCAAVTCSVGAACHEHSKASGDRVLSCRCDGGCRSIDRRPTMRGGDCTKQAYFIVSLARLALGLVRAWNDSFGLVSRACGVRGARLYTDGFVRVRMDAASRQLNGL